MNPQDDLLNEFSDVTSRIKSEFETLEYVAPSRRKVLKKKPFVLIAVAATIAVSLVVSPSLTGASDVNQPAWSAVPKALSEEDILVINSICLKKSDTKGDFEVQVVDERAIWGFLFATSSDVENMKGGYKFAMMTCQYSRTENGFQASSIVVHYVNDLVYKWLSGVTEVDGQKVWDWGSALPENVVRVEIETIFGLKLEASVRNGFTFAWFPRYATDNDIPLESTFATAYFYDNQNQLIESVELRKGLVQVG